MVWLPLLAITIFTLFTVGGTQFHNRLTDSRDPQNVSLVRQALTKLGINPNGITIVEMYKKRWIFGYSYQVTYTNSDGKTCHLNFEWKTHRGVRVTEMPECEGPTSCSPCPEHCPERPSCPKPCRKVCRSSSNVTVEVEHEQGT